MINQALPQSVAPAVASDRDPVTEADADAIAAEFLFRLEQVFRRLRQHRIPFCVLRNRDRIPRGLMEGSDVDVLVPAGTSASDLVRAFADLRPAHVIPHRATLEMYFPAGPLFLHVDFLIQDREWRGARYLSNAEILQAARDEQGIPMASPVHQAFCAWFSSLTRRGKFKSRYIPLITSAVRESRGEMASLLVRAFGRRLGGELLGLAERGELHRSDEFAPRCRRAIWRRALCGRPLTTLAGLVGQYVREARLWVRPPGLSVAVLGPDGSGKSAICSALSSASRAVLPFATIRVQHMYERALPRLSELKQGRLRRNPAAPVTVHDPHGKRPHTLPASVVALGYATVDQWLSRLCVGRRRLGGNALLLHDRYMSEIVVDPRRFRYGGSRWLGVLFHWLTPRLDLVILLDAPAEVLQSRKQEVPFEETRRQGEAYRAMVLRLSNGHVVDAARPVERVIEDVKRVVLRHLANRTRRRFGFAPVAPAAAATTVDVAPGLCGEAYPQ